jgi:2-methylisocitrate lyase-like PEP mutase family enzyme
MERFCAGVPGPKMANLVEQGMTPLLPPDRLQALGFKIVLYPLTLMNAATAAMNRALGALKEGRSPEDLLDFAELRDVVGFPDYYDAERKYADAD